MIDCESLKGRMKAICTGEAGLPEDVRKKYLAKWFPNVAAIARSPRQSTPRGKSGPSGCCGKKSRVQRFVENTIARAEQLKNSAVDFFRDGMTIATEQQQTDRLKICEQCPVFNAGWCDQAKGGCGCNLSLKVKARAAFCPQGKWFAHTDNHQPLMNPVRHLTFHLYPLKGKEWNWHWHIDQIRKHQDKFNGKIIIGVSVDKSTASIEEVQRLFDGIRVTHWLRADNNKNAETNTHVEMLSLLQTTDENELIFRYHTKGVTHRQGSPEQLWAEIMWTGNMDLQSVDEALASHLVCGVMRSQTPLVKRKPGDFFYAGSAYWMRSKEVFERNWKHVENNRWWVEFVPCHLFSFAESACLFHDLVPSSVLRQSYFDEHVSPEWEKWKTARRHE